jgi:hypothetical protein
MAGNEGELKKLKIEAYSSIKFDAGDKVDEFFVMFNPPTLSQIYEIEYNEDQAQGTSGSSQSFGKIKPQEYTFEFLIDGTGTAPPPVGAGSDAADPSAVGEPVDVSEEVAKFLELTYEFNGDLHRPYYLKLHWGQFVLYCIMKKATVTYTLFKPNGFPLRAKINATFSQISDDDLRVAREGRNSPDMTHYRQVHDGDQLPLMCFRIYGDMSHYLDVARYNNLVDFRVLQTGAWIAFPPLKDLQELKKDYA